MIYTGKKDMKSLKEVFVNPAVIATVMGIILFIFSIRIPYPIYETLNTVGSVTTPLSMIIVGAMLAEIELKEIFTGYTVYYASFLRLIAAPVITFFVFKLINADKLLLQICVIVQAMPASVLATVFAEKYGADAALAAKSVFITTIICLITIPLVVMFL